MNAPSGPHIRPNQQALLLMLLVLLGELPLLLKFFIDLWTRPQYDFFPLILLGTRIWPGIGSKTPRQSILIQPRAPLGSCS